MENKENFVKNELKNLLIKTTDGAVIDCEYRSRRFDEEVIVTFRRGIKKSINVTADSLSMLAIDVLKRI